ncbi:hypothetical protein NHJ13051_003703, partial [Beauveria bassiana]
MARGGKKSGLEASSGRWDAAKSGDRRSHIATGEGAYDPAKVLLRKGQPGLHGWPLSPAANRPLAALSGIAANGYQVAPPQRRALLWAEEGRGKEERGRVREQRRSQEAKRLSTILPHPPHSTPTRLPSGLRRLLRVSLAAAVFWNAGGAGTRCHLLVNLFGGSQCLGVLVQTLQRPLGFRRLAATWSELASRVLLACFHFYSCLAESQSALTGTPIHTRTQFS